PESNPDNAEPEPANAHANVEPELPNTKPELANAHANAEPEHANTEPELANADPERDNPENLEREFEPGLSLCEKSYGWKKRINNLKNE
ncbi:15125_t:CDS:1, partial [Dentiscutata heterogama]